MFGAELITRTKFLVPRPKRAHLGRDRLHALMDAANEVPVTEIVAGTGYGKSSLLALYLEATHTPVLWYGLSERDADSQLFALHLAHLVHRHFPEAADRALELLALPGGAARHGLAAIEALIDGVLDHLDVDTWLVLDDVHLLGGSDETLALVNHWIAHAPPLMHTVLSGRQRLALPDMARWRLAGDVLTLDQASLAFQADEVRDLFATHFHLPLSDADVASLMHLSEGWAMALPLLASRLREAGDLTALHHASLRDLFDYLAREVIEGLDPDERAFLLATAVLQRLEPAICDPLAATTDSLALLARFNERGVFLIPLDQGVYRHHHLFREFLLERLAESGELPSRHRQAARILMGHGEEEEAIAHLLEAGETDMAAQAIVLVGAGLLNQGRYSRLGGWIDRLPPETIERFAALSLFQGDICRLKSRYDEAIVWYDRAAAAYGDQPEGRSRALASKALVYLDTVQPALAEQWLESALMCGVDARRRAELLMLMAENKLNLGDLATAEALFAEARLELPEAAEHEARIYLRSGRLDEARALLRASLAAENLNSTRSHRETSLVLAFVEVMRGEPEVALELAQKARERAMEQQATFTEAVALIRLGHARLVMGQGAEEAYRAAIALAATISVARLKAEPLMGLALAASRAAEPAAAEALALEGLEIAQAAGDAWMAAWLSLTLGTLPTPSGISWLAQAQVGFDQIGDSYGLALSALWGARRALELGDVAGELVHLRNLTQLVRRHGYDFLLTRGTLFGFAQRDAARDFVERSLAAGVSPTTFGAWLGELGLTPIAAESAPEALRVRVLGAFKVSRAGVELGERAWGREKARQLFHCMLAHRGQSLPKTRWIDLLWPELDPQSGDQTFRVALNALNKALDPDRPSGQPSRFIGRQGLNYGLIATPELWIDAVEFDRFLDAAHAAEAQGDEAAELYRAALELSEGEFLRDFTLYEGWCTQERERLAGRYGDAALRLARMLARGGDFAGCALWAGKLIERDRTAEEAYRLVMIASYRQGDRALALRTYDRCVEALAEELDVDPMPETEEVFEKINDLLPIEI